MAKVKGKQLWSELKGAKEEMTDTVEFKFGDVEGEISIKFRELDEIEKIEEEFEEKMPDRPTIEVDLGNRKQTIKVPNEKPQYEAFNTHPEAKQYEEKVKPIRKQKTARLANLFIVEDERPSDDPEESAEILLERLRLTDLTKIMQAGMEMIGISDQLDKARKNS